MERKYLDFKSIRQRAPFLDVLARYNVEVRKVNHVQFKAKCPLPSHPNAKETDTFCVNVDKNIFICHSDSCRKAGNGSKGNLLDFVRLMDGVQAYEAAAKLDAWYPEGLSSNSLTTKQNTNSNGSKGEPASSSKSLTNHPLAFRLKGIEHSHPMLSARGISEETAKEFGVGYFSGKGSMAGRIVFELHENGEVVGYAGRLVGEPSPEQSKWRLPKGLVKSFVYGLEHCDPKYPLIIGESFWLPAFYHEKRMQAASLMGKEMTAAQEKCLAPFKIIWLALDNDEAGREASEKIAARLRQHHSVKVLRLME